MSTVVGDIIREQLAARRTWTCVCGAISHVMDRRCYKCKKKREECEV